MKFSVVEIVIICAVCVGYLSGCSHLGTFETILKHGHKAVKEHIKNQTNNKKANSNIKKENNNTYV